MLKDPDLACDALQDGFILVFRGLNGFKGDSTLGAWIKTIVVRACIKKLKEVTEVERIPKNYEYETVVWDDNLTGEELQRAIEQLPRGYRSVFLLIEVEGYSHKEVAEMLNIAEGTSKSQLYHSKQMLQKLLKDIRN
jgi:RNA polymerase sigma-70 factor (ECF subfamily)